MFYRAAITSGLLLLPLGAAAQSVVVTPVTDAGKPALASPASTAPATDAAAPAALATAGSKLASGHALYLQGDFPGALAAYEEAKELAPGSAHVYYFIGCAQARLNRYDDALVTWRTATTIAGAKDENTAGKALFQIAVTEEQRSRFDAAKDAWTAYQGFAQTHAKALTFVSSAKARLEALDKRAKLNEEYAPVREKIANAP